MVLHMAVEVTVLRLHLAVEDELGVRASGDDPLQLGDGPDAVVHEVAGPRRGEEAAALELSELGPQSRMEARERRVEGDRVVRLQSPRLAVWHRRPEHLGEMHDADGNAAHLDARTALLLRTLDVVREPEPHRGAATECLG